LVVCDDTAGFGGLLLPLISNFEYDIARLVLTAESSGPVVSAAFRTGFNSTKRPPTQIREQIFQPLLHSFVTSLAVDFRRSNRFGKVCFFIRPSASVPSEENKNKSVPRFTNQTAGGVEVR
jgi:hypothetical protein